MTRNMYGDGITLT